MHDVPVCFFYKLQCMYKRTMICCLPFSLNLTLFYFKITEIGLYLCIHAICRTLKVVYDCVQVVVLMMYSTNIGTGLPADRLPYIPEQFPLSISSRP